MCKDAGGIISLPILFSLSFIVYLFLCVYTQKVYKGSYICKVLSGLSHLNKFRTELVQDGFKNRVFPRLFNNIQNNEYG